MTSKDLEIWWEFRFKLLRIASWQLHRSVNYRRFHVGAAALVHNGMEYAVTTGANWMPGHPGLSKEKSWAKVCAETEAVLRARLRGYHRIVGIAVVGKPQPDDSSVVRQSTLHPCVECRQMLIDVGFCRHGRILTGYFVPGVPEPYMVEEHTFEALVLLHHGANAALALSP
jgi:cytidine deaminase